MASFVKDLLSVGLSKGGVILFTLLSHVIIARKLGPEANGVIAALNVYPALFITFGSLGISQATTYFVGQNKFPLEDIKRAIAQIWVFSAAFSIFCCYFLIVNFSNSGDKTLLVYLAILPVPFSLFVTYNSGIFLGKNNIGFYNKLNWIPAFLTLVSNALLVLGLQYEIEGALISSFVGYFFMFVVLLYINGFFNALSFRVNLPLVKSMMTLGITYAIALLVINLNYKVDIILLDKLSSNFELGIYSKGANLMEYLWQIPMLLSTIIFARSAVAKDGKAFSMKVILLLKISFVVIFIASLILFVLSPWVIQLLFGAAFEASTSVLRILLPGVVLLTIFKVLNMDLAGKGLPWISMKAMVPALVVNIVLNLVFIPKYGADGAAMASTISYAIASVLFLYFYSLAAKVAINEIIFIRRKDVEFILTFIGK